MLLSNESILCASPQKRYADPADVDKVQRLRGELERVRDAAVHNIGKCVPV